MSDFLNEREQTRIAAIANRQSPAPPLPKPEKRTVTPRQPPTKRRISIPERQLATIATISSKLTHQWAAIEATAAALAPPIISAAPMDPSRPSTTPNPTLIIALGHERFDDLQAAIYAWLEQGRWIEREANHFLRQHPDIARDADSTLTALRCDDPVCTANAVRAGKCWRHYRLTLQQQRASDE